MLDALRHSLSLPLHLATSSRAMEQAAQQTLPAHSLMARAGEACAKLALAIAPHAQRMWICCGPGNNGGDGLVAASLLRQAGREVVVTVPSDITHLPADARWAFARAQASGVQVSPQADAPRDIDLILDALLGLGLRRAPDEEIALRIARINTHPAPVLSLDLPSGLDGDTGMPPWADTNPSATPSIVRAQHTLSLLSLKPGLFTGIGRDHAGHIWLDDLGASKGHAADATLIGADAMRHWQDMAPRGHSSHKGSRGDVAVLGGATGMRGAAILASEAALAAGAGRVHLCSLDANPRGDSGARPELMCHTSDWLAQQESKHDLTLLCGCGAGDALKGTGRPLLERALKESARLVLDADALNTLASDPALTSLCSQRRAQGLPTLITPHPLEAARLLGSNTADVQFNRLAAARALAARFQCHVVLKGSGSVCADPFGRLHINKSGSAALAAPGTGDVLAGWMAGMWAQTPTLDPTILACAAVHWHGIAAHDTPAPLRAGDLIERMHDLQPCAD